MRPDRFVQADPQAHAAARRLTRRQAFNSHALRLRSETESGEPMGVVVVNPNDIHKTTTYFQAGTAHWR